jgi:hypothetical protein
MAVAVWTTAPDAGNTGGDATLTSSSFYYTSIMEPYSRGGAWNTLTKQQNQNEEVDIMTMYDVYLVYGGDRKNIVVESALGVIAANGEDAKLKSGLMQKMQTEWDTAYVSFVVRPLGEVKVKPRPKEVKQV